MARTKPSPASGFAIFFQRWNACLRLALVILVLGLGIWGFEQQKSGDFLDYVYQTLQMLTLNYFANPGTLNWQLQLARFLLPAIAVAETLNLISGSALRSIRHALLVRFQHPILITVGANPLGFNILHQLRYARDPSASFKPARRTAILAGNRESLVRELDRRIPTYVGDPRERSIWLDAHIDRARLVVLAHGDDIENLNAAAAAMPLLPVLKPGDERLQMLVLIERLDIADAVSRIFDSLTDSIRGNPKWRCISPTLESARALFLKNPLPFLKRNRTEPSHILILGLGRGAEEVLRSALTLAQDVAAAGPIITIIASAEELKVSPLLRDGFIPEFVATIHKCTWQGSGALPDNLAAELAGKAPVLLACICLADEAGMVTGLALINKERIELPDYTRVAVHQSREDQLFLPLGKTEAEVRKAEPFGALLPSWTIKQLLNKDPDKLARAIHEDYLAQQKKRGATTGIRDGWADISETYREANRAAAMHLLVKLAAIGYRLEAGTGPRLILSDSTVNEVLQIEHRRWCAERLLQGWRGGAIRDNKARIHPNLVPFAELDHETQLKDHDAVTAIPHLLASIQMYGEQKGPLRQTYHRLRHPP